MVSMVSMILNTIILISLLIIGLSESYKVECLGLEGKVVIWSVSMIAGLNMVSSIYKLYGNNKLNNLRIVLQILNVVVVGGLAVLSYKLILLESWNSKTSSYVVGLLGLKISRIWLTEEKLEAIECYWRENNNSYINELLLRLNEVSSGLELTQNLKDKLLGYSSPYEINAAIKIYFELKKQEHIKEIMMEQSWNGVMSNIGKHIYSFVISPLGLAIVGIMGVMFYYHYSIGSFKWLGRDYKNEALSDLHDGTSHLATATYLINQRVDSLYNILKNEGLKLKEDVLEINSNHSTSVETVYNAMKTLDAKVNSLTNVLSEEEKKIGFLKQLLGKGEEVGGIAANILLDNTVLQELDILREIMKDKQFGESFMARLVDLLLDNGYEHNKIKEPTKVLFPGIGKKLGSVDQA